MRKYFEEFGYLNLSTHKHKEQFINRIYSLRGCTTSRLWISWGNDMPFFRNILVAQLTLDHVD